MRPPDLRQVIEAVYAQEIARADEAKRHLFEPIGPLEGKVVAATADGTVGLSLCLYRKHCRSPYALSWTTRARPSPGTRDTT